jgi:hypothetical protein
VGDEKSRSEKQLQEVSLFFGIGSLKVWLSYEEVREKLGR